MLFLRCVNMNSMLDFIKNEVGNIADLKRLLIFDLLSIIFLCENEKLA